MFENAQPNYSKTHSLVKEVASHLLLLEELCRNEDIKVRAFANSSASLESFSNLPYAEQEKLGRPFINYVQACHAEVNAGNSIKDSEFRILWRILGTLGLRPGIDAFAQLSHEHSVEVYNSDFIQIYRNIRFMELCSYSLEEVFTWPLKELFYRNPQDDNACFSAVSKVLNLQERLHFVPLPPHVIEERDSFEKRSFNVNGGFVCSLLDTSKRPAGFIASLAASVQGGGNV